MPPASSITVEVSSGKVRARPDTGWEDAVDDSADTVALGPSGARRSVRTLRAHARGRGAHQLPDRAAGRRGAACPRDRLAGPSRSRSGTQDIASVPARGRGWAGSAQSAWAGAADHTRLVGRTAAGDRPGPRAASVRRVPCGPRV